VLDVGLYAGEPCRGAGSVCPTGPPFASWTARSGQWNAKGSLTFPWVLEIRNPNQTSSSLNGALLESWPATSTFNFGWGVIVSLAGAVILLGIGGVAVFLGLFLRPGVYGRPDAGDDEGNPPDLYDPDFPDGPEPGDDLDGPDEPDLSRTED
jgi:hypothetical protein